MVGLSIITPVRPGSPYVVDFLTDIEKNVVDKDYVEVILGICVWDEDVKRKVDPFTRRMNMKVVEIPKDHARELMHVYCTIMSHISRGWAISFLSDDIRFKAKPGCSLDSQFKRLEELKNTPMVFYYQGFGAYPCMNRKWFDMYGWGPSYGIDSFLNNVTNQRPQNVKNLDDIGLIDLYGSTDISLTPPHKVILCPSDEFYVELKKFVEKVK